MSSLAYATAATQHESSLKPFANAGLTEAQRASLRSIFSAAATSGESKDDVRKAVDAVLTPEQRQTLTNNRAAATSNAARPPTPSTRTASGGDAPAITTSIPTASAAGAAPSATGSTRVTNVQNQARAAQSFRINALLQQVFGTGAPDRLV